MKPLLFLLLYFYLPNAFLSVVSYPQQKVYYKVIGVKDGDTIELLVDGKPMTVRLAHIDCPEKKQLFGTKAKQATSDLAFGKQVQVRHHQKKDRYGRLIAEIILPDGRILNQILVKQGLAWHFKKYSKDPTYTRLEQEARQKKIGIWSEDAIAPEQWRQQKRKKIKSL
ncbi:thermonuclease family protein [Riemerella columbina]|uniref:thermonuclease family protein n=1 Tax=Riemerella columbina TaxID=103810 RepID=UPI00266EE861|nr:thermonuclease family protein [Riemerella columbina]WKS94741.1 thermonuclease family protein [Riemerella columbina]